MAKEGIEVRFLKESEYPLINHFFDAEGCPRLDPGFSKIVAGFIQGEDGEERVVGIMVLQMVVHAEPIIILPEFQGKGLWREMAEMLDGYMMALQLPGAYTQPMREETKAMCEKMGYRECEFPLWVKLYNEEFQALVPRGEG